MNKKKQIRKELKNYLDSKLEKGDLHIFDEVVNFIKKDRKKQLTLTIVNSTFVCEHPKRQRDYYSAVTYKCWKCKKIVVANYVC